MNARISMKILALNAWLGLMRRMDKKKGVTFEMHVLTHGCLDALTCFLFRNSLAESRREI